MKRWAMRCLIPHGLAGMERPTAIGESFGNDAAGLRADPVEPGCPERRAPLCVRVNRLRGSRQDAMPRPASRGLVPATPLACDGLYLDGHENVYATATFADGWIELQDEGSQLIAEAGQPPPGRSWSFCLCRGRRKDAGAGRAARNRGRLLALDVVAASWRNSRDGLADSGLHNVQALCLPDDWTQDGGAAAAGLAAASGAGSRAGHAPAHSGLGVLPPKGPLATWGNDMNELCATEARLLQGAAVVWSRPHGRLICSTCTVLRRKTGHRAAFMQHNPTFSLCRSRDLWPLARRRLRDPDGVFLRTLPKRRMTSSPPFCVVAAGRRRKAALTVAVGSQGQRAGRSRCVIPPLRSCKIGRLSVEIRRARRCEIAASRRGNRGRTPLSRLPVPWCVAPILQSLGRTV